MVNSIQKSQRIPYFCKGCPHEYSYNALLSALEELKVTDFIINGDIGCYELAGFGNPLEYLSRNGEKETKLEESEQDELSSSVQKGESLLEDYKPLRELIDTLFVMGSGICVSQGMQKAGFTGKMIAVAGDSTFFHSCMPGLINAVINKSKILYILFDNQCTAMTGHQENPSISLNIEKIAESFGVKFVRTINPYNVKESKEVFMDALQYEEGVAFVITRAPCILYTKKKAREKK